MIAGVEASRNDKGLIRSLNRRGTVSDKSPPVARKAARPVEPTVCDRCGAIFLNKTWRQRRRLGAGLLERAAWSTCPGCAQARHAEYFGRVLIRGAGVAANLDAIRNRIRNVAARAAYTQPERKLTSEEWDGTTLEVLTTSQKLAHRIVSELQKAFGGKASFSWSDADGSLFATWQCEPPRRSRSRGKS
jgi:NMD protein affecting ribosome stability and mRNA decay